MQAAVDPSTGKIDVSILTTGISGAVRKQRADRAQLLLDLIQSKGKVLVLKYNNLFDEFREKMVGKGEQVNCLLRTF
jgi:DNA replication licensing factor MCM4